MNDQQFAYWLQGFAELTGDTPPTAAQWKSIREHLNTVFTKVTPNVGSPRIPVDLKDSQVMKDLLEKARQGGFVQPVLPQPFWVQEWSASGMVTC